MKNLYFAIFLFVYPTISNAQFWEHHWQGQNYLFTGSGGDALTISNTDCEEALVFVTDPQNAPLPPSSPIIINPKDANGDDITDISAYPIQFTIRARSVEQVEISILFRSDDGTSDFRTERISATIPAGLEEWTEITLEVTAENLGGFNPGNLRDFWFYLDRGTENFAGNELYIDYIALGGAPTPDLESPCELEENASVGDTLVFAEYFQENTLTTINTGSTAGQVTTFTLDTICETLQISVTDPSSAPLPSFNAYFINPIDANGNELTDITGSTKVTMRVRSLETVTIDILFRSGGGTTGERTERKSVLIPGGLDQWTSFSVDFGVADLAGFNPADLRDMWFYLDRGTPNFAGNEFYIDHILIGADLDETRLSPCSTEIQTQTWIENWNSETPTILGGAETSKLNLMITECEELKIEVMEPASNPHLAFRPIVIKPITASGSPITNISESVQLTIRARSAMEVPMGVLFRSGDGSSDFRTVTLTQNIEGTLESWTTLTYTFTGEDLAGFNPEDLIDFWIFLDQSNNNFPGNEIYFDYITIGEKPDSTLNSPCDLPDVISSASKVNREPFFEVFPNPVKDQIQIRFDSRYAAQQNQVLRILNLNGQVLMQKVLTGVNEHYIINVVSLPKGLLLLQISGNEYYFTTRIVKE